MRDIGVRLRGPMPGVKVSAAPGADGAALRMAPGSRDPRRACYSSAMRSIVRSSILAGTRHGFSTRLGGASEGRYASLNLGRNWGDDLALVEENRRRLAEAGGYDPARLRTARQVHGAVCLAADGTEAAALAVREADALWASEPGCAVAVLTADCVPILFSDGEGRVAAAHAGWRGTVARIGAGTVEALVAAGARRDRIVAAIGPSIGPCCFEVGEEVAAQFESIEPGGGEVVRREAGRRPHVDLWRANARILVEAGVEPGRIEGAPYCTMCRADLFYSFRRDGAGIGQMMSFIVAGIVAGG